MSQRHRIRSHRPASRLGRGVSLVEVLVAVVILSLGVLSVVALQLVSKRGSTDAGSQIHAAQMSYDILERMRMNSRAVALTQYLVTAANGIGRGQQGAEPSPHCDTSGSCSMQQLAQHDLWVLEQMLDGASVTAGGVAVGGLPQPTACITGPATGAAGIYTVSIVWRSNNPIVSNAAITCGDTSAFDSIYGTAAECQEASGNPAATARCFRRALQIQAYITN